MEEQYNEAPQVEETPSLGLSQEEAPQVQQAPANDDSIAQKQQKHNQEENFRQLRLKHDQEKKALADKVNALEQQLRSSQGLQDDDIVEGRHFMGMKQEMENLRKQMEESQRKSAEMAAETQLKSTYTDLYSVVNEANLKKLQDVDPIAHKTILQSGDLYSRGHMAYQAIKKWGIADADAQSKKIEENLSKPQVGRSPGALSNAESYKNYISEDEKKAKWAEVQQYMKGL